MISPTVGCIPVVRITSTGSHNSIYIKFSWRTCNANTDIAGTINGVEGTGRGQALTASTSDENSRGIVINSEITPEELEEEGTAQGSITLISGVADLLYSELHSITNSVDGFIQAKIDSFDRTIDSVNNQIDSTSKRLEQRRARYVRKFTVLEQALARLESMQQRLTASLSALPSTSLF